MSPLATLIATWSAVYGYVGTYYVMLYTQRPARREYLTFGLLSAALSVYAVGETMLVNAETIPEGLTATRVSIIGLIAAVPFFVDFCGEVIKRPSRLRLVSELWAAIGLVIAAATDALFDPDRMREPLTLGFDDAPFLYEPRYSVFGLVYLVGTVGFAAHAVLRMSPVARIDPDARIIAAAAMINLLAAAHDGICRVGLIRSYYLLEHTAMIAMLAMSYVLLDRFVRTDEALALRKRELAMSYDELRHTQAELVRKEQLAAVGELSAVIAHEVRNPLAIIKNAASGLRRSGIDDSDRRTLLGIMDEETDRLNRLMRDLLSYARPVAPDGKSIEVRDLLRRSIELATAEPKPNVEIQFTIDSDVSTVHGDPELLRHALSNIVVNALQAMPTGGELNIDVRAEVLGSRPAVRLSFRDNGEGMAGPVREKALDPFFTTRPAGTGLGLSIVDRIIRNHGGTLAIESKHGTGTVVHVHLPQHGPAHFGADV